MDVQIIEHDMPFCRLRITGDQALKMRESIRFGARGSNGRFNHLPTDNIEIDEAGQGAMPNVFKFAPQHMRRLHRQVGVFALYGLHPGQLIQAERAFAVGGSLLRLGIDLTSFNDLFVAPRIGYFVQPVAEAMRL